MSFLVPEVTMAQRISRAKQRIRSAGATFAPPQADQLAERLAAVLHVLYRRRPVSRQELL